MAARLPSNRSARETAHEGSGLIATKSRRGPNFLDPRRLEPLVWLAPSLLLIIGIVVYPMFEMVRSSVTDFSRSGLDRGFSGLANFELLLGESGLASVLLRTIVWVIVIVGITTAMSLFLAQLLNSGFPGQRMVRLALIVPWAASVVVTMGSWKWILNLYYGILNEWLTSLDLIDAPIDFVGGIDSSFPTLIFLSVFLSIPFTVYVLLAGLQTIPEDLYEAARVDGAGSWRTYASIVLPLLRPSLIVATVLNVIFTFNSFTVIWVMTRGGPGGTTDITTTFAYKLAFQSRAIGEAAALSVVNLLLLMAVTFAYIGYISRRNET